ncbi:MAG: transglutaminase domain-containing protein [Puniceicoccaceae bacterium]
MEELPLTGDARIYEVFHETRYDYSVPVSLSLQAIRLTPRFRRFRQSIEATPCGSLRFLRDAYENPVHHFEWIGPTESFVVRNRMTVERTRANPFDFLLEESALRRPVGYGDHERVILAPFLEDQSTRDPALGELARDFLPGETETVPFLTDLVRNVNTKLAYEARDEPGILDPAALCRLGVGSCRDFASFLLRILRHEGFAARFVSGYLLETGDLRGAEAMHAWVEAYLPGAGWVGLDPTNGILSDDGFVGCAVGITPGETTPVAGRFFADEAASSTMKTRLTVKPL